MARGEFRSIEKSKQLVSFEGLVYGKLYPTNLDGVLDYHGKAWIIYEAKTKGVPFPLGQKIAIERMIDDLSNTGKYCIALLAEHEVEDPNEMVMLKDCLVRSVKVNKNDWRDLDKACTVKELTDEIIRKIDENNATGQMIHLSCFGD